MLRKCRLTNISDGSQTKAVEGEYVEKPRVGFSFVMWGRPLDPTMDTREVMTTPVQNLIEGISGHIKFSTENIDYLWEPM